MSEFSEVYGLLFIGIAIALLFLACYKIILNNDSFIISQLGSDYLASMFKTELQEFNTSIEYDKTFALPRFDAFCNKISRVIVYE
ncbi:MAG: hypothetical protein WC376_04575 [Candidatus Nanoarchaeia archaeon]|jgi:hypothetical protein